MIFHYDGDAGYLQKEQVGDAGAAGVSGYDAGVSGGLVTRGY